MRKANQASSSAGFGQGRAPAGTEQKEGGQQNGFSIPAKNMFNMDEIGVCVCLMSVDDYPWTYKGEKALKISVGASGREQTLVTFVCYAEDAHIIGQVIFKAKAVCGLPGGPLLLSNLSVVASESHWANTETIASICATVHMSAATTAVFHKHEKLHTGHATCWRQHQQRGRFLQADFVEAQLAWTCKGMP
eukprot:3314909-Amphidinium_carterae.2